MQRSIPKSPTAIQGKCEFSWLLNYWRITLISLARNSGVRVEQARNILLGREVEQEIAEKILTALSKKVGVRYTLNDVHIKTHWGRSDVHRTS